MMNSERARAWVTEVEWSPQRQSDVVQESGTRRGSFAPLPAVSAAVGGRHTRPIHDWQEPDWSILDDRRGELPVFPIETLPASCRDWLTRAARGAGVTIDHVAVPFLGIASGLVGGARRIKPSRSWSEP